MDFGLWSCFSSFERKRSRWKHYNQLPGNSAGSLVFLAVPKTKIFGKSLASSSQNSQPTGNIWNAIELFSSVGAQDTYRSWYELSDLEDKDSSWEDPAVDMDLCLSISISVFKDMQCLSTWNRHLFSPSIFDNFQMEGSTVANPIIVDDEENKENSAPTTKTTPESECPTEPPRLLRSRPFGTRLENVPDSVYRTLFR